jgi:hypothetical protein
MNLCTLAHRGACAKIEPVMIPVTHTDLLVLITVAACIHVSVLGLVAYWVYDSRRLTKAVGTLVLQEAEKIRRLVSIP